MKNLKQILNMKTESIADDDYAAALKLKPDLVKIISSLDAALNKIDNQLSSANAPGLKHFFKKAITIGMSGSMKDSKFNKIAAMKELEKYFNR